ncbi:MAG: hypothetical protein HOK82_18225 [Rhodospirillaceae bacterium]|nr:hypothetical protein [Rhodospirillaceae bacterium]
MGKTTRLIALSVSFIYIAIAALVMAGRPATAAPQILGLVASTAPVPLTCTGGVCAAELPAFCLQRERTMPRIGTTYRAGPGTRITLGFTVAGGKRHAVSVNSTAAITALRDYHAVRITVPESALVAWQGHNPTIAVSGRASAVPVPLPTHSRPLSESEIAFVTGPQRRIVARALAEQAPGATLAVATMSRLINALPRHATARARAALWAQVIGSDRSVTAARGMKQAIKAHDYCKAWADTGRGYGMRDCLREWHDHRADDITEKAWDMQKPGM